MVSATIHPCDELLTIPKVAKVLGVVPLTARIWVLQGRIPARDVGAGRLVVRRADLDAFVANLKG